MERGDSVKCRLQFKTGDGATSHAGLVCWRDRNIVYCLSNDTNNFESDKCIRRGKDGLVEIDRPISIANYNQYMGGVDLADMRRLHCNSTIMGQNRWWLKLFFYLLDVGTSNALVLHNEAKKKINPESFRPMNIVDFKMKIVESLVGQKINEPESAQEAPPEHTLTRIEGDIRMACARCAMRYKGRRPPRTRYECKGCGGVPLCSIGNGVAKVDCFAEAHRSEDLRIFLCAFHRDNQKNTPNLSKN